MLACVISLHERGILEMFGIDINVYYIPTALFLL